MLYKVDSDYSQSFMKKDCKTGVSAPILGTEKTILSGKGRAELRNKTKCFVEA
mgnify:CR=1 FL=1